MEINIKTIRFMKYFVKRKNSKYSDIRTDEGSIRKNVIN